MNKRSIFIYGKLGLTHGPRVVPGRLTALDPPPSVLYNGDMENTSPLSTSHLTAIAATLSLIDRGFDKRSVMGDLLTSLFPDKNRLFLAYWAGHRYVHLKTEHTRPGQEWILKDMVKEVLSGSAENWFRGFLDDGNRPEPWPHGPKPI